MSTSLATSQKKVPEITHLFWVIKILTTAMGEILSDYLVKRYDPIIAVIVATTILGIVFGIQIYAKSYTPWKYWMSASMVAIVGTMVADIVHVVIGIPYSVSTIGFMIILGLVFFSWYIVEKTVSIHSIYTKRRELFYWAAVVATFALGTATGDLTAMSLHLGYLGSGITFIFLIAIPAAFYIKTKRHEVVWFWTAYILTRPLGASFADWLGKSHQVGGLGLGEGFISCILLLIIALLVAYSTLDQREVQREHS